MFALKFLKIFLLAALLTSACRFWQAKTDTAPTPTPIAVEEIKSEIPFSTKEPESFQTEIVVTANGTESKMFTARSGANRLTIYEYQTANEIALLQTGDGKNYLMARSQKIYAENQFGNRGVEDANLPVAELLNQQEIAAFELLSDANDSAKYLVTLDASKKSEIVVTVDKKINLPVKQEFFSVNGEQKTLLTTIELKNFSLQTNAQNFEFPKDYKKVSTVEFQQVAQRRPHN